LDEPRLDALRPLLPLPGDGPHLHRFAHGRLEHRGVEQRGTTGQRGAAAHRDAAHDGATHDGAAHHDGTEHYAVQVEVCAEPGARPLSCAEGTAAAPPGHRLVAITRDRRGSAVRAAEPAPAASAPRVRIPG
jgi:hypothetical protein